MTRNLVLFVTLVCLTFYVFRFPLRVRRMKRGEAQLKELLHKYTALHPQIAEALCLWWFSGVGLATFLMTHLAGFGDC